MSERRPKLGLDTGEMPVVGRIGEDLPKEVLSEKGWTAGRRNLTIFKSIVLAALMAITLYGMLNRGLFGAERWLPVAAVILGLLFVTLFVTDYFAGVPRAVWVLAGLLAALVAIKGLSLTWSVSQTETVKELLRSSMYLGAFALAAASLSSRRLVGPLIDWMNLIAGAVAGYGVLQKTSPLEYPSNTPDGVRVGSTLEYANTVAMVVGMGFVLSLARMTQLKKPIVRGLYAALILVFGTILYFTFSRGGMLSLLAGLAVIFAVGERRLQALANLLLVSLPLAWLVWESRGLSTLSEFASDDGLRAAEGSTFRAYIVVAVVAAFLLQAGYAVLLGRYELPPAVRRALGAASIAVVLLGAGALGLLVIEGQKSSDGGLSALSRKLAEPGENVSGGLTSLSSDVRFNYWKVAWDEWKKYPLTGTGAGTFQYTWQKNRPDFSGVRQVHNTYLEQGTETGVFAFLALAGFAVVLVAHLIRSSLYAAGERKILLASLTAGVVDYLISSAFEWHWYIVPSTLFFFIMAGIATRYASGTDGEAVAGKVEPAAARGGKIPSREGA